MLARNWCRIRSQKFYSYFVCFFNYLYASHMTGMNILPIRIQIFWVHRICSCWVRDLYLKTNVFSHPPFNFPHPYSLLSSSSLTHSHLSQSFLSPALIPHNQYTFPHFPHSLFRKHVTTWPYTLVMQPLFSLTFVTYRRFPLTIISLYCSFSSPFIFLLVIYLSLIHIWRCRRRG